MAFCSCGQAAGPPKQHLGGKKEKRLWGCESLGKHSTRFFSYYYFFYITRSIARQASQEITRKAQFQCMYSKSTKEHCHRVSSEDLCVCLMTLKHVGLTQEFILAEGLPVVTAKCLRVILVHPPRLQASGSVHKYGYSLIVKVIVHVSCRRHLHHRKR